MEKLSKSNRIKEFTATVPVANGRVPVEYKDGKLSILSTTEGETLVYNSKRYAVKANEKLVAEA